MVGGGYTWSKLRGNDDEEEGTLSAPRNLPLKLYYPEFLGYPQRQPIGYLRQDQRHRARIMGLRRNASGQIIDATREHCSCPSTSATSRWTNRGVRSCAETNRFASR
jgi:hypothetical protein